MSQITILNQVEDETVRIAIFKKPIVHPSLQTIAWQIVDPPPLGQCVVPVPADYTVFAKYSNDPPIRDLPSTPPTSSVSVSSPRASTSTASTARTAGRPAPRSSKSSTAW